MIMKELKRIKVIQQAISLFIAVFFACGASAQESYSPFYSGTETSTTLTQQSTSSAPKMSSILNIEDSQPTQETHPFSGSEETMEELDKLEPINTNLKAAVDAHNLINRLRGFKNIQKQYNNMVKLHDHSVKLLQNSEQCTIDYMGRYFKDPIKVWSGRDMSATPQNHDLRQGLSAWAVAMFETAKSAEVSPIDIDDVVSVDLQTKDTVDEDGNVLEVESTINSSTSTVGIEVAEMGEENNLETIGAQSTKQVENLDAQTGGVYFKEPSRQEELEAEDRKTDLMTKDIGAEVAVWMADYLAGYTTSQGPEWNGGDLGGVKQRFPVWTDQKTFYGQYLIRKYKHIKQYIKDYRVPEDVRKRIADKVFERQEEYMDEAEKQITQAAVNARLTALGIYNQERAQTQKKYEETSTTIEEERDKTTKQLDKELKETVAVYNAEQAEGNQKRDQYMEQISDINTENSNLSQEINELEQEVSNYDTLLADSELTEEQRTEYEELKAGVQTEIGNAESKIQSQISERDNLQKLYDEQTEYVAQKQQEKEEFESDIQTKKGQVNDKAVYEQQVALNEYNAKIAKIEKEYKEKIERIDAAEVAAKATIGSKSMVTAQQIIGQTDLIIEDAKQVAYDNTDKTLAALRALEDDLYRGQAQATIASYHQALIDTLNGKDANIAGLALEAADAKVRDITNFNVDIVISSYMDAQMREMYLSNYRNSVHNTTILLRIPLFDKMLEGVYTGVDSQYFVGLYPKEGDFAAPKALPDYNLPPLREYIRLDYIDLQNIGKDTPKMEVGRYKTITLPLGGTTRVWEKTESLPISIIDKEKFLSYGGKIPEIWKLMLKDKAFVDSEFYLTADMDTEPDGTTPTEYNPLQLGAEMSTLYRGGVYPCVLKNIKSDKGTCTASGVIDNGTGVVDVAIIDKGKTNSNEYFMGLSFVKGERRTQLLSQGLPTCQEVSAKCKTSIGITENGIGIVSSPYLTLLNKDDESGNASTSFVTEGESSELGSIINVYSGKMLSDGSYVQRAFGYSPYMQSVVNYGIRMEERGQQDDAEELNAAEQQNDDIYVRAQYNNNQVGDFLDHVELEQNYQQALDELEEQVKETKEELYSSLKEFGFEPSADFDISKTEDYDLAVKQLKTAKENYMNTAKGGIDSIEPGDSEVLSDSKNSYQRIYQGLLLDNEAVVSMTMDVDNLSDFSEQIKTATTNNTVGDEYEKNADEDFEETLRSMKPAYCAAY